MSDHQNEAPLEKPVGTVPASFSTEWTCAELSSAVCDALVASGKLKTKPAFIRGDREIKITELFQSSGVDGAFMASCSAGGVEDAIRNATEGEEWLDDVQGALRGILSTNAANSCPAGEVLWTLSYSSFMRRDKDEIEGLEEVNEIVLKAKTKNEVLGITGTLVYDCSKRKVFQVIEGNRTTVLALYSVISQDSRHCDTTILESKLIDNRQHESWMAVHHQSGIAKLPSISRSVSVLLPSVDEEHLLGPSATVGRTLSDLNAISEQRVAVTRSPAAESACCQLM